MTPSSSLAGEPPMNPVKKTHTVKPIPTAYAEMLLALGELTKNLIAYHPEEFVEMHYEIKTIASALVKLRESWQEDTP